MNKEEIKAVLAIIKRQSFIGATRTAIENNLEYRLLCSAATKLERMLLDIESGYNNGSRLGRIEMPELYNTRRKRNNRVKQLKRTIARLTEALTAERRQLNALWLGDHLRRFSPEWDAFIQLRELKTPADDATLDEKFEYWVALRAVGKSVLNAACLAAMAYGEAKGNAENGQQPARKGEA